MQIKSGAFVIFIIAAISDFLDGFLARKLQCESKFGQYFDNIADKMLNIAVICVLLYFHKVWLLVVILFILREVLMPTFREYASICGHRIEVDLFGKIKTTLQVIWHLVLMLPTCCDATYYVLLIGNIIFAISAALSWVSVLVYILKFLRLNYVSS